MGAPLISSPVLHDCPSHQVWHYFVVVDGRSRKIDDNHDILVPHLKRTTFFHGISVHSWLSLIAGQITGKEALEIIVDAFPSCSYSRR